MTAGVRPTIVVLDYGSGNLRSAERAVARAGGAVTVTASTEEALRADGLLVPGVGAFAACMSGLKGVDGVRHIQERKRLGRPVLGICVGMQVLFTRGDEHGVLSDGVGVLPGDVTRLVAPVLPHMGWNTLRPPPESRLFSGVAGERFYFVHSYAARAAPGAVTWAEHGERFVAAVEDGTLAATQFHPEKSGDAGAVVLANWVATLR